MLKNELRIGNRVKEGIVEHIGWRDGYYTVGCMKTGFESAATFYDSEDIHQIPLTEEILLKCGFVEKHKWFYKENFILGYTTTDDNLQAEYKFAGVEGDWKMIDIKYLHQLQNLYFALTGQELEINL